MKEFHDEIVKWFGRNGFDNVDVCFDFDSFGYNFDKCIINIGVGYEPEAGRLFEQFLYEYGMEYVGFYDSVLAFLHELGHYNTVYNFNRQSLSMYNFIKVFQDSFGYWEVPDEMAANIWVVDFVNENIGAVEELCNIFLRYGWIE